MIPDLISGRLDDRHSLIALFDANQIAHAQIFVALTNLGIPYVSWPMAVDPMPDDNWMEHHSTEHSGLAQLLGIQDPGGLNQFDLNNQAQFDQWVALHAQHHDLIGQALGLP